MHNHSSLLCVTRFHWVLRGRQQLPLTTKAPASSLGCLTYTCHTGPLLRDTFIRHRPSCGQPWCSPSNPAWILPDPDHLAALKGDSRPWFGSSDVPGPSTDWTVLSGGSCGRHTEREERSAGVSPHEGLGAYALLDIKSAQGPEVTAVMQAAELATGLTVKTYMDG